MHASVHSPTVTLELLLKDLLYVHRLPAKIANNNSVKLQIKITVFSINRWSLF